MNDLGTVGPMLAVFDSPRPEQNHDVLDAHSRQQRCEDGAIADPFADPLARDDCADSFAGRFDKLPAITRS